MAGERRKTVASSRLAGSDAPRTRLPSLTSLRFFAALLVFLHHAWGYAQFPALLPVWPSFEVGHVAVGFFFLLSGFVLTWSLVADAPAPVLIGRRIAKIYPLHLLTLVFAAVVMVASRRPIDPVASVPSFVLLQAWFPDPVRYAINGPSWSISAELFFYLLFPFLAPFLARVKRWRIVAGGILGAMALVALAVWALSPPGMADYLLYTFPPFRLGEFAIGILLAAAMRHGWRPRIGLPTGVLIALGCFALFTAVVTVVGDTTVPRGVFVVASVPASAALISAAAAADLAGRSRWLSRKSLVALGNWSFAFYLFHLSVLILFRPEAHGPVSAAILLTAALATTIALSAAAHILFERPLERRLRRWVESRWGRPR